MLGQKLSESTILLGDRIALSRSFCKNFFEAQNFLLQSFDVHLFALTMRSVVVSTRAFNGTGDDHTVALVD